MPRPTSQSRRLSKKTPDEGGEAQGGLPHVQGRVVVRERASSGSQADHPQGMESYWREAAGEGASALRVDLPLRLRTPEERRGLLARAPHRQRRGVLAGFGELRQGSGSGQKKTRPARARSSRVAHSQEE